MYIYICIYIYVYIYTHIKVNNTQGKPYPLMYSTCIASGWKLHLILISTFGSSTAQSK